LAAEARETTVKIRIKECKTILAQSKGLYLEKMVGSDCIDLPRSKKNENFENRRSNERRENEIKRVPLKPERKGS